VEDACVFSFLRELVFEQKKEKNSTPSIFNKIDTTRTRLHTALHNIHNSRDTQENGTSERVEWAKIFIVDLNISILIFRKKPRLLARAPA
jgi:hypothetical protein